MIDRKSNSFACLVDSVKNWKKGENMVGTHRAAARFILFLLLLHFFFFRWCVGSVIAPTHATHVTNNDTAREKRGLPRRGREEEEKEKLLVSLSLSL